MKGLVFTQLQEFVETNHGYLAWDNALTSCELESEGIYVATKSYDDDELFQLVGHFCGVLNVEAPDLIRAFGEFVFERLIEMAPEQAKQAPNLKAFLHMVEEIIHVEVRKLYNDANLPEFDYEDGADKLVMIYASPRKLCHLSEGLILGAAKHFKEEVSIRQTQCVHQGADKCHIEVTFL